MANLTEAKIYVGTYSKYNNGSIAGAWLDLSDYSGKEEFYEACAELHSDETDHEFMFQDHENIPKELITESSIADSVFQLIEAVSDLDDDRQEAFFIWANNRNADLKNEEPAELIEQFDELYQGHYDGYDVEKDFAEYITEELDLLNGMAEDLKYYFDYQAYGRDLFISDYWEEDGHVFRNS